jgi:hypothetical protein
MSSRAQEKSLGILNVVASGAAMILLCPPLALIAVAVWMSALCTTASTFLISAIMPGPGSESVLQHTLMPSKRR